LDFVEICPLRFCEGEKARVNDGYDELAFQIFNIGQGLRTKEVLSAELIFGAGSVADALPSKVSVVDCKKVGVALRLSAI
jgi:hypothetical protein